MSIPEPRSDSLKDLSLFAFPQDPYNNTHYSSTLYGTCNYIDTDVQYLRKDRLEPLNQTLQEIAQKSVSWSDSKALLESEKGSCMQRLGRYRFIISIIDVMPALLKKITYFFLKIFPVTTIRQLETIERRLKTIEQKLTSSKLEFDALKAELFETTLKKEIAEKATHNEIREVAFQKIMALFGGEKDYDNLPYLKLDSEAAPTCQDLTDPIMRGETSDGLQFFTMLCQNEHGDAEGCQTFVEERHPLGSRWTSDISNLTSPLVKASNSNSAVDDSIEAWDCNNDDSPIITLIDGIILNNDAYNNLQKAIHERKRTAALKRDN